MMIWRVLVLGLLGIVLGPDKIEASTWWTDQAVDITEYERLRACVARNLYSDYLRGVLPVNEQYMLIGLGVPLDYKKRREAEQPPIPSKESEPTVGDVKGASTFKQSPQSAWKAVSQSQRQ